MISALRPIPLAAAFAATAVLFPASSPSAQEKPFKNVVLTEAMIGDVPAGRYKFKVTMTTIEPGAQIPAHLHSNPGVRYVLEGAITINWAEHGSQTFTAGSTYYEAAGQNHPAETMSASNPLDTPMRVLIVELVPADK